MYVPTSLRTASLEAPNRNTCRWYKADALIKANNPKPEQIQEQWCQSQDQNRAKKQTKAKIKRKGHN